MSTAILNRSVDHEGLRTHGRSWVFSDHDQVQTPHFPTGDGACSKPCDCGVPCGRCVAASPLPTLADRRPAAAICCALHSALCTLLYSVLSSLLFSSVCPLFSFVCHLSSAHCPLSSLTSADTVQVPVGHSEPGAGRLAGQRASDRKHLSRPVRERSSIFTTCPCVFAVFECLSCAFSAPQCLDLCFPCAFSAFPCAFTAFQCLSLCFQCL